MPESTQLKQLLHFLDDSQAIDVVAIDVRKQTTVTDYMIVATGRSSRHVKAIASNAMEHMKSIGAAALSDNGLESGDWVLVDFGDYVLHVMQPDSRAFYNLEGLWQDNYETKAD
jgi:ribosome-associated protein